MNVLVTRALRAAAVVAAASLVTSCLATTETRRQLPPVLRFVNATPENTVEVFLDELPEPITILPSANVAGAGCFIVLPENHLLTYVQTGDTLYEFESAFQRDAEHAVVLVGDGMTYRGVVVTTDQEVADGMIGVNLINASATAGDVYITAAADEPTAATRVASALAPAISASTVPPSVTTPTSRLRVRLFDVGTTTNPRADLSLDAPLEGRTATIVFTQGAFPASGGILVQPCDD